MTERQPLVDDADREHAIHDLELSAFLAAGAGTGKSTTLVSRIIQTLLAAEPRVSIDEIVAITFTEKAGAELRHRLRTELQKRCAVADADPRLRQALLEADTAQVGTIHSFATRILRRFAIEAGLPLGFEVTADVEANQARRQRARDVIADMHELREIDRVLRLYRVRLKSLLELVEALDVYSLRIDRAALDASKAVSTAELRDRAFAHIGRFKLRFESDCIDENDKLYVAMQENIQALLNFLGSSGDEELAAVHLERAGKDLSYFKLGNKGTSKSYRTREPKDWRDEWKSIAPEVCAVLVGPLEMAVRQLLEHAGTGLAKMRDARRSEGAIEFDDLLSMAEELVSTNAAVRARLHSEIRVMLIDEFQDTDPLQWELIRRITADPADPEAAPLPGRLIVVGDPKQAIYSFRGADVRTYQRAAHEFRREDGPIGQVLALSSNFRTVKPILDWVNEVFTSAMQSPTQVVYDPLEPVHDPLHDAPGPSVLVLRDPPLADDEAKPDVKAIEAHLVAGSIRRAIDEGWQITDRLGTSQRHYVRAANFRDVAVLFPTRSSLDALLNAFDALGIPYRSSDAALIFDRPAVLGVINALAVIADPGNELSLWMTLKSPLFGCTDTDLLDYRTRGGSWRHPDEPLLDNRAARAIRTLNRLRRSYGDAQPVHAMNALFDETRVLEALALAPRGGFDADALRMLRTHAQQWQDQGSVGLVEYIETLDEMRNESSRAQFPAPDDLDDDAVRLMTVFAAKGLEFPIVALAGMTTKPRVQRPPIGIVRPDRIEFALGKTAESIEYGNWYSGVYKVESDEERMRVLYVACTRAMDHLIVSLCGETSRYTRGSAGDLLRPHVPYSDSDVHEISVEVRSYDNHTKGAVAVSDAWLDRLAEARTRSTEPFVALPSGSAAGALGLAVNVDDEGELAEPRIDESTERMVLAMRDGAAFGQCLHATMDQLLSGVVPLTEEGIALAAQASLEKVEAVVDVSQVMASARAAIASSVVQEALAAPRRWSELYLATATGTSPIAAVEGIADLVFETAAGEVVVVDYKTDRTLSDDAKQHYAEQLACYAAMLTRVTGRGVIRRVVVHVPGDTATLIEF